MADRNVSCGPSRLARGGLAALSCLLSVLLWAGVSAAATEVTTCGQVVSGSAFLSGDLDCSSAGTDAVVLDGGTFDLRGFTITGDSSVGSCGVLCTRSCKVISVPTVGAIMGAGFGICDDPFDAEFVRSIRVRDLLITANAAHGIDVREATVRVLDSTITNNGAFGVIAGSSTRGRIRVVNSTIANNGAGVDGVRSAVIRDSTISGNTNFGAAAGARLSIKNSQITGNGTAGAGSGGKNRIVESTISGNGAEGVLLGLSSERLRVLRSTIDGNGSDGIFTDGVPTLIRDSTITNNGGDGVAPGGVYPLRLIDSAVSGNGFHGVSVGGLKAVGSTLTANGTDPDCGVTQVCADVASFSSPSLKTTTCDTSYDRDSGFPGMSWGVCSLD